MLCLEYLHRHPLEIQLPYEVVLDLLAFNALKTESGEDGDYS